MCGVFMYLCLGLNLEWFLTAHYWQFQYLNEGGFGDSKMWNPKMPLRFDFYLEIVYIV
jgi:hypothetical protein